MVYGRFLEARNRVLRNMGEVEEYRERGYPELIRIAKKKLREVEKAASKGKA